MTSIEFVATGNGGTWFGAGAVSYAGDLLEVERPSFGSAVKEISVEIYYGGVDANYDIDPSLRSSSNEKPQNLPRRRFERKRCVLSVKWLSKRLTNREMRHLYWQDLTHQVILASFDDLIDAVEFAFERITPNDDFDAQRCLDWMQCRRADLPEDTTALKSLIKSARETIESWREAKIAADPWTAVDVDWSRMHKNARALLNDPFYWDQSHDFAPHGGDTGADIFAKFAAYRKLTPLKAVAKLFGDPGFMPEAPSPAERDGWRIYVQTCLALAFGHIKKYGECSADLAVATRDAISQEIEGGPREWRGRDEFVMRL